MPENTALEHARAIISDEHRMSGAASSRRGVSWRKLSGSRRGICEGSVDDVNSTIDSNFDRRCSLSPA